MKDGMMADLRNRFTYHKPIGDQPMRYEMIRNAAHELAILITDNCPVSKKRFSGPMHR